MLRPPSQTFPGSGQGVWPKVNGEYGAAASWNFRGRGAQFKGLSLESPGTTVPNSLSLHRQRPSPRRFDVKPNDIELNRDLFFFAFFGGLFFWLLRPSQTVDATIRGGTPALRD